MLEEFLKDMAIIPALIGAAGSLIGAGIASSSAKSTNEKAYEQSKEFAQSKHQWETEDLEKAGLNRILSVTQGASSGSAPQLINPGDAWKDAAGKAAAAASSAMDLSIKEEQVKNLELTGAQIAQATAESAARTEGINYQNDVMKHQKGVEEKKWRILDNLAEDAMGIYDFTVGNVKQGLKSTGEVAKEMWSRHKDYSGQAISSAKGLSSKGQKGQSELSSSDRKAIINHPPNREPVHGDPLYYWKMLKHKDWKKNPQDYSGEKIP